MESIKSVTFTTGLADDPRTFSDPCPPIEERAAQYRRRIAIARLRDSSIPPPTPMIVAASAIPEAVAPQVTNVIVSKPHTDAEDSTTDFIVPNYRTKTMSLIEYWCARRPVAAAVAPCSALPSCV